ncbi:MAG: helicase-related protein [Alphaproteobacteria bacterium]
MGRFENHESFRQAMLEDLRNEVFGPQPHDADDRKTELLQISPLQQYSTGILFPQKTIQNEIEGSDIAEGEEEADDSSEFGDLNESEVQTSQRGTQTDPDTTEQEALNLSNEFSPSAVGVSFRIKEAAHLEVRASFGTYVAESYEEPNPRAGLTSSDGSQQPTSRTKTGFRRIHHDIPLAVKIPDAARTLSLDPIVVPGLGGDLTVRVTVRPRVDGVMLISVMAVNEKRGDAPTPRFDDAFYQVQLSITDADNKSIFLPIDLEVGNTSDDELSSMELLYRHRRAFALGHGCAGDWTRDDALSESGRTNKILTAALPSYEIKPIVPREESVSTTALLLSMSKLSGHDCDRQEIFGGLRALSDDYRAWIHLREQDAERLPNRLRVTAEKHLTECRNCLSRVERGIEVLSQNESAFLAFRLMNRAMLMQQYHTSISGRPNNSEFPELSPSYDSLPDRDPKWRPFQLAFVLMNVAGMTDANDPDRKLVDLIWFPTGGGKTEAYLGLAAFTICFERLEGRGKGVVALMRYTLRLLTAQQFQRATALILCLDVLRRERALDAELGSEEISIGLWVGQSLSPNRRADARAKLKALQRDRNAENPFQVLKCPWCGTPYVGQQGLGYYDFRMPGGEKSVGFKCPDHRCRFSAEEHRLPVYVIDDDIYEKMPTLVIGTVDKFAQIAWEPRTGRLFGAFDGARPPVLVIQDELHLISGPLGTIVGLYETAIDRLCSRDGYTHKVVASTATIRRAREQCESLYDRETFEFPPQGIRAGDSYFALEDTTAPGRLYVGFMGTGVKSHQTALVRACSPLLQSACEQPETGSTELSDPYGTLVWYFSSLRELGHAATLCTGDIPEHLKGLCHRRRISADKRRKRLEVVEMTSRRTADEIPAILDQLSQPWNADLKGQRPVDVLLATNMIAVGVDVPRLGLICMSGQPKSSSEYIQATSRVGRRYPGLVLTVYTQTKSRDRSHYERFVAYHQSIYKYVEPTSVTPFSPQARDRGMRGVLIALSRLMADVEKPDLIDRQAEKVAREIDYIIKRVEDIDEGEASDAEAELLGWLNEWKQFQPNEFGAMAGTVSTTTLAFPFGEDRDPVFQRASWPLMTSMRNVDGTCEGRVLNTYPEPSQEGEA